MPSAAFAVVYPYPAEVRPLPLVSAGGMDRAVYLALCHPLYHFAQPYARSGTFAGADPLSLLPEAARNRQHRNNPIHFHEYRSILSRRVIDRIFAS